MARFTTALSQAFLRSRHGPEVLSVMLPPAVEPTLDDAEDCRRGPGWFDSSWDLRCGLEVREGLPGDPQLNEWIEACLRGEPALAQQPTLAPLPSALALPPSASPMARGVAAADRPCDWALV